VSARLYLYGIPVLLISAFISLQALWFNEAPNGREVWQWPSANRILPPLHSGSSKSTGLSKKFDESEESSSSRDQERRPDEKGVDPADEARTVFYRSWPLQFAGSNGGGSDTKGMGQKAYTQFYGPWPGNVAEVQAPAKLPDRAKNSIGQEKKPPPENRVAKITRFLEKISRFAFPATSKVKPIPRRREESNASRLKLPDESMDRAAKSISGKRPKREEGKIIPLDTRDSKYASYFKDIKRKIQAAWHKPYEARSFSGKLKLKFAVRKNGSLARVELMASTGSEILDKAARDAVTGAAPFRPFPQGFHRELLPIEGLFVYER